MKKSILTLISVVCLSCYSFFTYSQSKLNPRIGSYLSEFVKSMSSHDVGIVYVSRCESDTKIYLTTIYEMSSYVNNLPSTYFLYEGKVFLVYNGAEKLLAQREDMVLRAKLEKILEQDLAADGKDRNPEIPMSIYDPMFWELRISKEGEVVKSNYNGRLPGWSYWSDRH